MSTANISVWYDRWVIAINQLMNAPFVWLPIHLRPLVGYISEKPLPFKQVFLNFISDN